MSTKKSHHRAKHTETPIDLPWNWGAFFFGWMWGVAHRSYITLISLVPSLALLVIFMAGYKNILLTVILAIILLALMVIMGLKGSEWAWHNNRWESFEHFQVTQRNWGYGGLITWLAFIALGFFSVFFVMYNFNNFEVTKRSLNLVSNNRQVQAYLGKPIKRSSQVTGKITVLGGVQKTWLRFNVSGSIAQRQVKVRVNATRENGMWRITSLRALIYKRDKPIVIISPDEKS